MSQSKSFDRSIIGNTPQDALDFIASILEASTEYSIIAKDLAGRIVLWNEGARRIYGYEPEEIIGLSSNVLHTPEDVAAGQPKTLLDVALRDGKWEGSIERVRKGGQRFTAQVVITPRSDARGRPVGFLLISRDISRQIKLSADLRRAEVKVTAAILDVAERKRFEQELQEKNVELEKANQAKDRFLARMSHELRTPLNAVIGFTGTLLMKLPGPLTADQENQLQTIRGSAKHLLSLINDLLDLAKIESGKVVLNLEPVSVRAVVTEVAAAFVPLAQAKALRFDVILPDDDVIAPTDRRALSQIVINLTNNAIKFTETGFVKLELKKLDAPGRAEISVTDSGIGICEEDQRRLFQPFEQVDGSSKRTSEGSGLGLYLSQKLASLLGTEIVCRSEPGKGTCFSLVL
jgi:PAS domain S-box-containing protein